MAEHNETGRRGEELAVAFLEAKGYKIFDRNYRFEKGEIDIVAFIPNVVHFVEVKTRRNSELNNPELTIGKSKLKVLGRAGSFYLWERKLQSVPAVFDVVAIGLDDPSNPIFVHYENALSPENPYF